MKYRDSRMERITKVAKFADIIGQEQLREHLQNAIRLKKVSHAYIINGERCAGKEFIANIFAMALQCERGGEEPCQECHSCRQALSGNQPDIIRVTHEKPNTIGVEDIRTQIGADIAIKPYSSPYKIYIMNEGEKMTVQAQNALLKTLEEPPAYGITAVWAFTLRILKDVFKVAGALMTLGWSWLKKAASYARKLLKKCLSQCEKALSLLPLTWQWIVVGGGLALWLVIAVAKRWEEMAVLWGIATLVTILYGSNCFGRLLEGAKLFRMCVVY